MFPLLVSLFLYPLTDVNNLSDNSWELRSQVTNSLKKKELLALPAVLYNLETTKDLESRKRSQEIADYILQPFNNIYMNAIAFYLLYGPEEIPEKLEVPNYLGITQRRWLFFNRKFVEYMSLDQFRAITKQAVLFKIITPEYSIEHNKGFEECATQDEKKTLLISYLNYMRFVARGSNYPGELPEDQ